IGLAKDATEEQALEFVKGLKKSEDVETAKTLASVELAKEIGKRAAAKPEEKPEPKPEPDMLEVLESQKKKLTHLASVAKMEGEEAEAFVVKHLAAESTMEDAKKDALKIMQSKFANPG